MQILFVTQFQPNPTGKGSARRAAQHMQALATLGEITLVLPEGAATGDVAMARARACGAKEIIVRTEVSKAEAGIDAHRETRNRLYRMWRALRLSHHLDGSAQDAVRPHYRETLSDRFDLVFAFRIKSATWIDSVLPAQPARPRVSIADFDDIESVSFENIAMREPGLNAFWRWKMRTYLTWLKRAERAIAARWSATIVCSGVDAARMAAHAGRTPWVVPNAFTFGTPAAERTEGPIELLFVGTLSYAPNGEGIAWFIERVWPTVRAALGDVRLTVLGFDPPPSVRGHDGREGITVIGDAPEVTSHYARANIVIVPIHAGSGTRIKILEAAAHGRAIVTTALGCEGLDLNDGVHAEIADDADAFAGRVIALAQDAPRRTALAQAALVHARANFDMPVINQRLVEEIRMLTDRAGH